MTVRTFVRVAGAVAIGAAIFVLVWVVPAENAIWNGKRLAGNWPVIWHYTQQHVRYTLIAVAIGTLLAIPLSLAAVRAPRTYPALRAATNPIYAIPSVALIVVLSPWLGFTHHKTIVTAITQ